MGPKMKALQDFFDGLSTKGGNIVVLSVCSVGLGALLLHMIHHNADAAMVQTVATTFSGFTGALLLACNGNSSRQQMQDRIDTASGAAKVDVQKAQTVNVDATKPGA